MTPYWCSPDGSIVLYLGDCIDVMPRLEPDFDMVLADLPYGATKNTWDRPIPAKLLWDSYDRLVKPSGAVVLHGQGQFAARMIVSNEDAFRYQLVWDKGTVTRWFEAKRRPLPSHEELLVFYRAQPSYTPQMIYTGRSSHSRGRSVGSRRTGATNRNYGDAIEVPVADQGGFQYPRTIIRGIPALKNPLHPTQKPVELAAWMIRTYTRPGDLVLDNVVGSGTTLLAARAEGRRAVGIELSEEFCEMAATRLDATLV